MPLDRLHMTTLEITHSLTEPEVATIVNQIQPAIPALTDFTFAHRARLIKPLISYDAAGVALSFVPAAGEGLPANGRNPGDDEYSYHHLRRDMFNLALSTGVKIESRYVVPSAHVTCGRFLTLEDHNNADRIKTWLEGMEDLNSWLQDEFWPKNAAGTEAPINIGGEWLVGQGKGLDLRKGTLWYGGGETVRLGDGF